MSALKGTAARKVLQENLERLLVGAADHAKTQEEAAEGIFLVVHDLLLCRDALLRPCHQAELADELSISLCRLVGNRAMQPRESDAVIGQRVGCLPDVKGVRRDSAVPSR